MTSLNSLIRLKKPVIRNKKLMGLLTIAFLIIAAMGAGYYFYIKANQEQYNEARLLALDTHLKIIDKKIKNEKQGIKATDSSKLKSFPKVFLESLEKEFSTLEGFDQFRLKFMWPQKKEQIITETSIEIKENVALDSIFKQDLFNNGIITTYSALDEEYQLFAKEYRLQDDITVNMVGMVTAKQYAAATRSLDPWILALLTTFLLVCLFGLPFFKMLFIAEDERLFAKDIIMAGLAVLIGFPVLFASFLAMVTYLKENYVVIPHELRTVSGDLQQRFQNENEKAIQGLEVLELDTYTTSADSIKNKIKGKEKDTVFFLEALVRDSTYRNNFKYLSVLDTTGKGFYHINWIKAPSAINTPKSLGARPYFKDFVAKQNVWYSERGTPYVMRPVISIEDGTEEAVYITQLRKDNYIKNNKKQQKYRVASSRLKAIYNGILPFGYNYAIIDQEGEVWFHSQKNRATLESFFTVSKADGPLRAAVRGRLNADGKFIYHGASHRFHTRPIEQTNLSVVTFYDIGLLRIRIAEILTLCSIAIFVAILLAMFVAMVTVAFRNIKWGLYTYRVFLFEFLTPKKAFREKYILLTWFYILITVISLVLMWRFEFPPSSAFLGGLLLTVWSYSITYHTLSHKKKSFLKLLSVRGFLLLVVVLVLNYLLWHKGTKNLAAFSASLWLQLLCFLFFLRLVSPRLDRVFTVITTFLEQKVTLSYRYWYVAFMYSALIVASVLPTTIFFAKAKKADDAIWAKTDQHYILNTFLEKQTQLKKELNPPSKKDSIAFKGLYKSHLNDGQYLGSRYTNIEHRDSTKLYVEGDESRFLDVLWYMRPIFDERIREYQAMVYNQAADSSWNSFEDNGLGVRFDIERADNQTSNYLSILNTDTNAMRFTRFQDWLIVLAEVLGIIALLGILFALLLFYVDRFFGFRFRRLRANDFDGRLPVHDINDVHSIRDIDNTSYVTKFATVLNQSQANSGLMLVGPPVTGKRIFAERIVKASGHGSCAVLSFLRIDDINSEDSSTITISEIVKSLMVGSCGDCHMIPDLLENKVFIIENLEHGVKSFKANNLKLRLVSFLIAQNKRVILCSEIYPSQILGFYSNQTDDKGMLKPEMASDFNAWRNIMSAFPQILIGITKRRRAVLDILNATDADTHYFPKKIKKRVAKELGYSRFLPTLASIVATKNTYRTDEEDPNSKICLDAQRMVLHTQNLAHGYYTDIWNSLPSRERYMLYDLASDGFLNIKNGNSLFSLMKKGLVVWNDRPVIFNSSFKNFISSSVATNEALRLELKNSATGSWSAIRIVIYLVIGTIITFIFLGEPGLVQDFETLIAALGGIGVIIPILSSVLANSGKK